MIILWRIDQLMALVDDRVEWDEIRGHLLAKQREVFRQRFGHYPNDPTWKRPQPPEPLKILDPETNTFREIPRPITPILPSRAELAGHDIERMKKKGFSAPPHSAAIGFSPGFLALDGSEVVT